MESMWLGGSKGHGVNGRVAAVLRQPCAQRMRRVRVDLEARSAVRLVVRIHYQYPLTHVRNGHGQVGGDRPTCRPHLFD